MFKPKLIFKLKQMIDHALLLSSSIIFISWLITAVYSMVTAGNLFAATEVFTLISFSSMHAVTALNISLLYLTNIFLFRTFLPGHLRVLRAVLFTTVGVFFYDTFWSMSNLIINGYGSPTIPLLSFLLTLTFMLYIHNGTIRILKIRPKLLSLAISLFILLSAIFLLSGFFQQWALYEHGLASDPHGWIWLIHKTYTLWFWLTIALT